MPVPLFLLGTAVVLAVCSFRRRMDHLDTISPALSTVCVRCVYSYRFNTPHNSSAGGKGRCIHKTILSYFLDENEAKSQAPSSTPHVTKSMTTQERRNAEFRLRHHRIP